MLPNIYLFNPTCEYAVANGKSSWQPNALLQKMEEDLGTLPLFLAKKQDYILTNKIPSKKFVDQLNKLRIDIPEFILKKEALGSKEFLMLPKNKLLPWGWSPAAHKLLSPLKNNCMMDFQNSPVASWKEEYRDLYSKAFARDILTNLLSQFPSDYFLPQHQITKICTTKEEIENLIMKWGQIMIKAPWSSSGRGLQPLKKQYIHQKVWDKILAIINEQGYAIVEPYHTKILDLAFQFKLRKGKVTYLGISNFVTDNKGQYIGNYLNGLPNTINEKTISFAVLAPDLVIEPIKKVIEESRLAKNYEGHFGVDTLIFLDEKNKIKINPCLEINVRQNMGLLSLKLEKLLHPEKKGMFQIYFQPKMSFHLYKKQMEKDYPLKIENGKIKEGFFSLIDSTENTQFGAYILV